MRTDEKRGKWAHVSPPLAILVSACLSLLLHSSAEAQTVEYRSIGTQSGNLVAGGNVSSSINSNTLTFSGVSLPANVGLGDKLHIDSGGANEEVLFVLSREESNDSLIM